MNLNKTVSNGWRCTPSAHTLNLPGGWVEKKYFQSICTGIALTGGCVNCHNSYPNSPKKDFVFDDVMESTLVKLRID